MQTAGRGPNETVSLDKLTVEAESASGSGGGALAGAGAAVPKLRATVRSTMPAQRQPGPLACTPQDGSAAAPGSAVRRRSPLGGAGGGHSRRPLRSPAEPERPSPLGIP
jgi:hypothetical protein